MKKKTIGRPFPKGNQVALKPRTHDLIRLTRAELVAVLIDAGLPSISNGSISDWVMAGLAENDDRTLDIRKVAAWAILKRREKVEKTEEAMMSGETSPALERWRTARAIDAERHNRIEDGEYVKLAEINAELQEKGARLKNALEAVAARYGPECRRDLDSVLVDSLSWVMEEKKKP